jgi:NAD(P)-dependent dehydrogenase (short-subunit alcohol dehydrogenase family)
MDTFQGRLAVVTGGGMGMGRELVRQLAREGCSVAMCDVSTEAMAETVALVKRDGLPTGVRLSSHIADVSDERQLIRFRDELSKEHGRETLNLLFNNAGVGADSSFVRDSRERWDKTFAVCWGGVYLGCRTFLPMMIPAKEGHIVNTSSANGFWASAGPFRAFSAYCAAKFAVKGFTESLVTDLRLNAPHIKCSVVMPGHVGTAIHTNTRVLLTGTGDDEFSPEIAEKERQYATNAPTSAAQAAGIILDGVRANRWRILVGHDAELVDRLVRENPEEAYEPEFFDNMCNQLGSVGKTFEIPEAAEH